MNTTFPRMKHVAPTLSLLFMLAACSGGGYGIGGGVTLYTVGVTVTGLAGSGLVLQNNGGDDIAVSVAGTVNFYTFSGTAYAVTVKTQPSSPTQNCVVTNGSGTVATSNISNVAVACTTTAVTVGGTVSGLTSSGLVLQNNAGDDLPVSASGTFSFTNPVATGQIYEVTVKAQPTTQAQACAVASGSGTVISTPIANVAVTCGSGVLSVLVGKPGGGGSLDGSGSAARFYTPSGTAVDANGNVYVADAHNHAVRKISPAGLVTTLAGSASAMGSSDGTGSTARFQGPKGVAVDRVGDVYVADTENCTIRKITVAGVVTTLAGAAGAPGSLDGTGSAARFSGPQGVAVDRSGNVLVADTLNNTIRIITPAGVVSTLAGSPHMTGAADGAGAAALFFAPSAVTVDDAGNVYVADTGNSTVRRITPAGVVTTQAGTPGVFGSTDGVGGAALFRGPAGIASDSAGNIFVEDGGNGTIRRVTPTGAVTTIAGTPGISGWADGTGAAASFGAPLGLSIDLGGTLFIADAANDSIRRITPTGTVTTFAGAPLTPVSIDASGAAARYWSPLGIATDTSGNTYVADYQNQVILKIAPTGVVTTLAGATGSAGNIDGQGAAARFKFPYGVATDAQQNVYVADAGNFAIRRITPAGVVTTLAGLAGQTGSTDGTGAMARFGFPGAITVDASGLIYVADGSTIRRIDSGGAVTTLAGLAGNPGSADGTGSAARFYSLVGVATDGAGNVYATDLGNSTVRKITPAGVVTTVAGSTSVYGWVDGAGTTARFFGLAGVTAQPDGTLYVADQGNSAVRKITPGGVVSTVVGMPGSVGVALGALPGALNSPVGVALLSGPGVRLVVADYAEGVILVAYLQ